MKPHGLAARLFVSFLAVAAVALVLQAAYDLAAQRAHFEETTRAHLESTAWLARERISGWFAEGETARILAYFHEVENATGARMTFVLASGEVLADSSHDPASMESHRDRPEIRVALAGATGQARRYSATLHRWMLYVAVPMPATGQPAAVVRAALPLRNFQEMLAGLQRRVLAAGAVLLVAAALLAFVFAQSISRPLRRMERSVEAIAGGRLDVRPVAPDIAEFSDMADAIGRMAARLARKIADAEQLGAEEKAIFDNMLEAVLVVGPDDRVRDLNAAACEALGRARESAVGRLVVEVAPNRALGEVVHEAISSGQPKETEVTFFGPPERFFLARVAPLRRSPGAVDGVVAVLSDVTGLRRLERIRRDFVANASHELRTPVTAIRGFAESLRDAEPNSEQARRFADTIARKAADLGRLIEDLLALSALEHHRERPEPERRRQRLAPVLERAVEACGPRAAARGIALRLDAPDGLEAPALPELIERAVVNLVDNAVQYSDPGSAVEVEALRAPNEVRIVVRDHGCGIDAGHLPRIFERFYRVDKARSRRMGGTGLGLAIVRNVAEVHHGRVTVESRPGQGSTFTLHLPG